MNPRMQTQAEPPHIVGYATFIKVWIALVVLTGLLVGLIITPTKASLVFFYFMHLKYESAALKYMVAAAIAVLIIFIGLTFSDYLFR
jgi:cytochrome c oxidase subunit 4